MGERSTRASADPMSTATQLRLSRQERERAVTRAATKTATAAKVTARKRAANAAKPKVDTVTQLCEIFAERLAEAHVTTKSAAAALSIDERDRVLDVCAWGGDEDTAWERVVETLSDDSDDDSDDEDGEQRTRFPLQPLTSDPKLQAILDTIVGDTAEAVGYAFKAAFTQCTPKGTLTPPRDVVQILGEQYRRTCEQFTTTRRAKRSSSGKSEPKGEFTPVVQATLDWLTAQLDGHKPGDEPLGFTVKDIAAGMGRDHSGTIWHAVKTLVEARRVSPMPDNAKMYRAFPSAAPAEAVTADA